jgi:4-amino-4-deoxy-L-arabinose transferase-like glycosyltransferase
MSVSSAPGPSTPTARSWLLAGWTPWIAILCAALAARLTFVAVAPPEILARDAQEYEAMARLLLERGTYGTHTLRPPGYPTLIAAVYALFGPRVVVLRVIEALLGTLAVGLIGAAGTRLFGRRAGLVSGALAALHPVLAYLPSIQYSENTLVLVVALAWLALFEAGRRGGLRRWALSGVLWGVALLIRPNTVLMVPGLAAGLALALARERRAWLAPALACAAAAALVVTPWIVRNHRVHGEWYFIATGGGRQLWVGNNPRAEADSRVAGFHLDSLMEAETRALPNQVEMERYFYRKGLDYMREHPGRAVILYLRELRNLFAFYPETRTGRHINAASRTAQGLASAVLFAGVLLALSRIRSEPGLWPLAGSVASYALGSAFFFTIMRYRMTVEPGLLWMAGAGWSLALARWAARAEKRSTSMNEVAMARREGRGDSDPRP